MEQSADSAVGLRAVERLEKCVVAWFAISIEVKI
jgi:hypothetical protein